MENPDLVGAFYSVTCEFWQEILFGQADRRRVCFCRLESNTFVPYVKYCKVVMLHGVLRQSQLLASRRC